VAPRVIVTLGNFATRALLVTTETVTRLRGKSYPYAGTVVVPTFHPSYALRGGGIVVAEMRADLVRAKRLLALPDP
jgi:DNA polymerase